MLDPHADGHADKKRKTNSTQPAADTGDARRNSVTANVERRKAEVRAALHLKAGARAATLAGHGL